MSDQPFARILPFLSPIAHLLRDPTVTDIMVNQGGRKVFYAKGGCSHPTDITIPPERLEDAILKIARNGVSESDASPAIAVMTGTSSAATR